MAKKKSRDLYSTKRPGTAERLSSRFSLHGTMGSEGTGGKPDLVTVDFAAAIGSLSDNLARIAISAKHGNWPGDREQLRDMVARRSWDAWREDHNQANVNIDLNNRITDAVLGEFYLTQEQRSQVGDTARARKLGIDHRRYKAQIKRHYQALVSWLDMVEQTALQQVARKLRR